MKNSLSEKRDGQAVESMEKVPSTMKRSIFLTFLQENLSYYFKSKRFLIMLILTITLSLLVPVVSVVYPAGKLPDMYAFASSEFGFIIQLTILITVLLAGDSISQDYGLQGLFTLTQPIGKTRIFLSRTIAIFLATLAIVIAYISIAFVSSKMLYGGIPPHAPEFIRMEIAFVISLLAFVELFSSLFKNPLLAMVIPLVILELIMSILIPNFEAVQTEPWILLFYAGQAIPDLLLKNYPKHAVVEANYLGVHNFTVFTPYVSEAFLIILAYAVICFTLSWAVYYHKEFK